MGNTILRGIAFCSPSDYFLPKFGRDKALGRAIKALERGENSEATPKVAAPLLARYMYFLSAFNPKLTVFELGLVEAARGRALVLADPRALAAKKAYEAIRKYDKERYEIAIKQAREGYKATMKRIKETMEVKDEN